MKTLLLVANKEKRLSYLEDIAGKFNELSKDTEFKAGSLEELNFIIEGQSVRIYDESNSIELIDFDLVVFRIIGSYTKEAVAVASYCGAKGIKFIDSMVSNIAPIDDDNKLGEMVEAALNNYPVPKTAYGNQEFMISYANKIGYPVVLKSTNGSKGKDNYIINSTNELKKIVYNNRGINFIIQAYVPNDSDYRILVLNYDKVVVTLRKRTKKIDNRMHLNNVSSGAEEILITDITKIRNLIDIAREISELLKIEIAGVDIVVDKNSGLPYIMEVNRAPQLTLEPEIKSYYQSLIDIVRRS